MEKLLPEACYFRVTMVAVSFASSVGYDFLLLRQKKATGMSVTNMLGLLPFYMPILEP